VLKNRGSWTDQDELQPIGLWLLQEERFYAVGQQNDRVQKFNFGVLQSAVFICFQAEKFETLRK
jgi:hypothetical protein